MASASHDQATGLYSDVLLTPSEFVVKQRRIYVVHNLIQTQARAITAYYVSCPIGLITRYTPSVSVRLSVSVRPVTTVNSKTQHRIQRSKFQGHRVKGRGNWTGNVKDVLSHICENRNLAIANRSCVSYAHNTSRAPIITP